MVLRGEGEAEEGTITKLGEKVEEECGAEEYEGIMA